MGNTQRRTGCYVPFHVADRCRGREGTRYRNVIQCASRRYGWLRRWKPDPPKLYPMPDKVVTAGSSLASTRPATSIATKAASGQFLDGKATEYRVFGVTQFDPRRLFRDRDGGLWIEPADRGLLRVHHGRTDVFAQSDGLSGEDVLTTFEGKCQRKHTVYRLIPSGAISPIKPLPDVCKTRKTSFRPGRITPG